MVIHMVKPIPMKESGPSRITIAHAMWGRNYAYCAPGSAGSAQSQGVAHGPAQRLGSVNDEQVGDVWLQPALDQVGQQLTMAAFSVAPKATTSTCFSPAPSMPIAATST
jgi:hypothetical protein